MIPFFIKHFGKTTSVTDTSGKTVKATDAGGTLVYTYLSSGNQQKVTLSGTDVSLMEYDEYGNQTKLTDKNAGTTGRATAMEGLSFH